MDKKRTSHKQKYEDQRHDLNELAAKRKKHGESLDKETLIENTNEDQDEETYSAG